MASTYSNWDIYHNVYAGRLGRDQYEAFARRAMFEIDRRTFGRGRSELGKQMAEQLSMCECELVDAIHAWAQTPGGVSSVTNDGLSVSYGGRNSFDGLADEPTTLTRIVRRYLTCPINLLYSAGKCLSADRVADERITGG